MRITIKSGSVSFLKYYTTKTKKYIIHCIKIYSKTRYQKGLQQIEFCRIKHKIYSRIFLTDWQKERLADKILLRLTVEYLYRVMAVCKILKIPKSLKPF